MGHTHATPPYDAVVLAGGSGLRLGGAGKAAIQVGGSPLLDRVLAACDSARRIVVVGPPRRTPQAVAWTREEPPGGGPAAALGAALPLLEAPVVVVLAVDLPFMNAATVRRLVAAACDHDAAMLVDPDGREQYLAAAYRRTVLAAQLGAAGPLAGIPLRRLLASLDLARLPDPEGAAFDCDTWDDVPRHVRRTTMLDDWIAAVKDQLGVEVDVDVPGVLDLARVAAHNVDRPAAPLTTFLVGYAVAQRGGPSTMPELSRQVAALAETWRGERSR